MSQICWIKGHLGNSPRGVFSYQGIVWSTLAIKLYGKVAVSSSSNDLVSQILLVDRSVLNYSDIRLTVHCHKYAVNLTFLLVMMLNSLLT